MGCGTAIILVVIGVFVWPVLSMLIGYLTGMILAWTVGDIVVNGLNLLFATERFSVEMLPTMCAALAVVGSFFNGSFNYSGD